MNALDSRSTISEGEWISTKQLFSIIVLNYTVKNITIENNINKE